MIIVFFRVVLKGTQIEKGFFDEFNLPENYKDYTGKGE
jgi:hypothetical protein